MNNIKTSLIKLFTVCLIAAFAQGCNTVQGLGKDLSAAGDKIEESAKKNKSY